ncbi:type II secretion system protein GspG [Burkholderia glumae]|uniref:type II secretion system protein GspG n=1 Tax=Burkholderia glumae TaxID=337 RepID=UPI0021518944|nr:type II secretion system protein GspG [Burkholderia glumae]
MRSLVAVAMALTMTVAHGEEPRSPYGCNARCQAEKVVAARQDIDVIGQALALYHRDKGTYPSQSQGLAALTGSYLERMPSDPWGHPYQYLNPGKHGPVDVYSYGATRSNSIGVVGSWQ